MERNLLPRAMVPLTGHKCLGAQMRWETKCECGWHSCPYLEKAEAYQEWRSHVRTHGAEYESIERWDKREAAHRRKLGLSAEPHP